MILSFTIFLKGFATTFVTINSQKTDDPTHGGLFTTSKPYVDPDEYVQPENKQDQFDWRLTKVSEA